MRYFKIQQEMIRNKKANKRKYYYTIEDGKVLISQNRHFIMAIPEKDFFLDVKKVAEEASVLSIILKNYALTKLVDTHTTIKANGKQLHVFKVGERTIYVDEEYINYFDEKSVHYTGRNERLPVYVWEHETLVGAILPVIYNG